MTCAHCDELRERVMWLESELGIQRDAQVCQRIERAIRYHPGHGRPQVAAVLAALYNAKGRPVSDWQLMELVPGRDGDRDDDRNPGIVKVWIHRARASLGQDAIQNVRSRGYCLSDKGMAQIAALVSDPQALAA